MSRQKFSFPVTVENGTFSTDTLEIRHGVHISGGLYEATKRLANVKVTNCTEDEQTVIIDEPLEVNSFNTSDFIEVDLNTMKCQNLNDIGQKAELNIVTLDVQENIENGSFKR